MRVLLRWAAAIYLLLWVVYFYDGRQPQMERPPHVEAYLLEFGPLAFELERQSGIPPAIPLAVAGLESGWGQSELARVGNNHFGIKAKRQDQKYCVPTSEYVKGKHRRVRACFRAYEGSHESFLDFCRVLTDDPRYNHLLSLDRADYHSWAKGLQDSGYATDPRYARKIVQVVEKYGLHELKRNRRYPK
jgi:flagellum-specific peptidoglycan hydrolase FlgJ